MNVTLSAARLPRSESGDGIFRRSLALSRSLAVLGCLLAAYGITYWVLPRYLTPDFNFYLAQPLLWSGLALVAYTFWRRLADRSSAGLLLIVLAALAGVFQVAVLVMAGLLYGFGHSPYAGQALNMAKNGLYFATLLLGIEMSRAYLVQAWARFHAAAAFVGVALLYTAVAVAPSQYQFSGTERAFELAGGSILPGASESVMATFLASLGGAAPAFAYRLVPAAFEWFSPILPDLEWPVRAFVATLGPVLAMLIVRDVLASRSGAHAEHEEGGISPLWMMAGIVVVGLIWLNAGLLGVRPALVSGISMEPALRVGDVVFTKEVPPETLQVGDIVRYRNGSTAVVHRIIEIEDSGGNLIFVTKGDNNNVADQPILAGQIEGKVILTIPKAGWVPIYIGKAINYLAR